MSGEVLERLEDSRLDYHGQGGTLRLELPSRPGVAGWRHYGQERGDHQRDSREEIF